MIDLTKEEPIPLAEVPKLRYVPRRAGKQVHIASVYRWTTDGIKGVVLESIQAAGVRVTTRSAILDFFERLSQASGLTTNQPRTRREERRAVTEAERVLDNAGVGGGDSGRAGGRRRATAGV